MFNKKNEKLIFVITIIAVFVFMLIMPFVVLPKITRMQTEWLKPATHNTSILEMWEIDTFEGGSSSRVKFLEKTACLYQEETLSTYILVRSLDCAQAQNLIANGTRPDLISFGVGAGELVGGIALPQEMCEVRADLQAGGIVNGEIYATPWCMGGYVLCSLKNSDLSLLSLQTLGEGKQHVIGTGAEWNMPYKTLSSEELKLLDKTRYTQFEAYESFLNKADFQVLLGTQRDFFRLNNKYNLGVIDEINYRYMANYTDLVQYVAITTLNQDFVKPCQDFIKYLTQSVTQRRLTSIGMFAVNGEKIYANEYQDFEIALLNKMQVLNVFTPNVTIKESLSQVFNDV